MFGPERLPGPKKTCLWQDLYYKEILTRDRKKVGICALRKLN